MPILLKPLQFFISANNFHPGSYRKRFHMFTKYIASRYSLLANRITWLQILSKDFVLSAYVEKYAFCFRISKQNVMHEPGYEHGTHLATVSLNL